MNQFDSSPVRRRKTRGQPILRGGRGRGIARDSPRRTKKEDQDAEDRKKDAESPLTSAVVGSTTSACASASLEQLLSMSDAAASVVMKVATSSGNLKGTFVKLLKDAAKAFVAIGREIGRRSSDDPSVTALRGQLKDAESAISLLREELAETKARLARVAEGKQKNPPPPVDIEEIVRRVNESMMAREEAIMARFEAAGFVRREPEVGAVSRKKVDDSKKASPTKAKKERESGETDDSPRQEGRKSRSEGDVGREREVEGEGAGSVQATWNVDAQSARTELPEAEAIR
ncbi:hypothetical protein RUM43_009164 [Polyplax serrata]|uniref:Uncharacterized protein n=1 Tax=Polyplax serrata TaxID=468196 RepID=A0AAN8S8F2_POLSC